MNKYTNGPWKLDATNIVAENGTVVIDKGSILWNFGQGQANAKLIASAPELLEACKTLLEMVDEMLPKHGPCGWGTIATDEARQVIAKATGQA